MAARKPQCVATPATVWSEQSTSLVVRRFCARNSRLKLAEQVTPVRCYCLGRSRAQ